jgi:hypothetical protein
MIVEQAETQLRVVVPIEEEEEEEDHSCYFSYHEQFSFNIPILS